jgi:hypothetical protein
MRTQEAKQLSLPELLARLGHLPVRQSGNRLWYRSPLRVEKIPSFCVEPGRKLPWIFADHGANIKGNILDFVMQYQHCAIKEALAWLQQIFSTNALPPKQYQHSSASSTASIQICRIKQIQHPALRSYLKERAIETSLARPYLREVHYWNAARHRFALGWKTETGGWCLRAPNFKAFLGPAGITTIGENNKSLAVFEGIFDFLAALAHYRVMVARGQVIILNSVNHLHIVAEKIACGSYQSVRLYLDNDLAGRRATQQLLALPNTLDCSHLYSPAKDLADWYAASVTVEKSYFSFTSKLS